MGDLDPIVGQLAMLCLTSALSILVGWGMNGLRHMREQKRVLDADQVRERDQTRKALRVVLRYRLTELHRHYVVEGHPCPAAEKQDVQELYEVYHSLGGNGAGTHMYKEIMATHVAG